MKQSKVRFANENLIEIEVQGHHYSYEVKELPKEVIDWQIDSRIETLERIAKGERVTRFGPHLPVIITRSIEAEFPVNAAIKGVGLVPKEEYMKDYMEKFEEIGKKEPKEALKEGIELVLELIKNPKQLDFRRFGSLEIFGGRTFRNIKRDPRVALHFFDFRKGKFLSYMVCAIAQIFDKDSLFYRFESAIRSPFIHAEFHLPIRRYLGAYSFWICEVYDKSPGPKAGKRIA